MRWRYTASTRTGWLLLVAGVSLLAALVVIPRLRRPSPPPVLRPPDNAGPAGFLDKPNFQKLLQPIADPAAAATLVSRFAEMRRRCRSDATARVDARMTRVLDTGEEFDSDLVLYHRPEGATARFRLDVHPVRKEPWTYLAELRDTAPLRASLYTLGKVRRLTDDAAALKESNRTAVITVGDLGLSDAIAFMSARDRDMTAAGWVDTMGSQRLFVIDWRLPPEGPGDAAQPTPRGSALLYLYGESLALRTARVFDVRGNLERVVGDLEMSTDGDPCHLVSFHASSPARHSHTVYHIDRVARGVELDDAIFSEDDLLGRDGSTGAMDAGAPR